MITGDYTRDRLTVEIALSNFNDYLVSAEVVRGGTEFGPYRSGPDVGTCILRFYQPPGTVPAFWYLSIGQDVVLIVDQLLPTERSIFWGNIQDFSFDDVFDEVSGLYGTQITVYATDGVADIQSIPIRGQVTSATTKNVTWETRIATLAAIYPHAFSIPALTPENHVYRLVDNNVDGSLADQLNIACNSVGATWYVGRSNGLVVDKKGSARQTGCLFTDTTGYWTSGNKPANAGSTVYYNLTYSNISFGSDTANIANTVAMTNIMPKNMITSSASGTLRYKDPVTTPGPDLEVLEQAYTAIDAASVATYGIREKQLTTNVYPYRTSDTESYYVRFNAALDPGNEYQNTPQIRVGGTMANATVSNVTPRTGTYCTNVTITTAVQSFGIDFGPSGGYPLKARPTSNINPFQFYFRTSIAKARYRKGIVYLDSAGNILSTQVGGLITPTVNVWGTNTTVFMNYTTIPAGAVSWRPIMNVESSDGTNFAIGDVFKFDDYSINPVCDTASIFSGDTTDTATDLYSWEDTPGASYSYLTRNVLDNIGSEVLTYWASQKNAPRSITWNGRQNWDAVKALEVGGRVDIHYNGNDYIAWISTISHVIDNEDIIVTLGLSSRPSSWN